MTGFQRITVTGNKLSDVCITTTCLMYSLIVENVIFAKIFISAHWFEYLGSQVYGPY